MNSNRKTQLIAAILVTVVIMLPWMAFAQIGGGGGGGGGLGNPDVPIDGGLSVLVAAGVAYGAKKVHDARKKKQQANVE